MYARELALAGVGIAYLFEPLVRTEIRKGLLKQLMPQTAIEADGLFFLPSAARFVVAKTSGLY